MSQFCVVKPNTKIQFIKHHTPIMIMFCLFALAGLVIALIPGQLKWGTSFEGGTSITIQFEKEVSAERVRQVYVDDKRFESVSVQSVGDQEDNRFVIRTKTANAMTCAELNQARDILNADIAAATAGSLAVSQWPSCNEKDGGINGDFFVSLAALEGKTAPETPVAPEVMIAAFQKIQKQVVVTLDEKGKYLVTPTGIQGDVLSLMQEKFTIDEFNPATGLDEIVTVGADVGEKFRNDAIVSIFLALALMLLYIAVRFDIRYAPSAVVSLFLTTLITLGCVVVLKIEITLESVAAFLSLVGYGINDTIVTFDRVRENSGLAEPDVPLADIVNKSINDCLSRTAITSLTTLLAVVPMAILATGATQDFAIIMTIGIIISTFDSIFLSCPFLLYIDKWLKKYQEREAERKALDSLKVDPEPEI